MRIFLRIMGILMILAALVLFFYQDIREYFTDQINERIITAYEDGQDDVKINPIESMLTGVEGKDTKLNISDDLLAVLEIESTDILDPLFKGPLTEEKLINVVSVLVETDNLEMQNINIAGHRVEGAGIRFNYIDRAEVGDEVKLITREETKVYKITEMFEVDPTEVDVLNQEEDATQELTLITCEDYNPDTLLFEKRLIVKAELVS